MRASKINDKSTRQAAHEYQGGIQVLVILLDVVRIVVSRLPLVHRVEIEPGVVVLDGLEERPEGVFQTAFIRRSAMQAVEFVDRTRTYQVGSICNGGESFLLVSSFAVSSMTLCTWFDVVGQ